MKCFLFILCWTILVTAKDIKEDDSSRSKRLAQAGDCICPDFDPLLRRLHFDELAVQKRNAIHAMWPQINSTLTEDQGIMRDVILKMSTSDSDTLQQIAFVNSIWLSSYLPYISQSPQLCPIAQMINSTVEWQRTKNPEVLSDALKQMALTTVNAVQFSAENAFQTAGCPLQNPKFRDLTCFDRGLTYEFDDMWKKSEILIPYSYKKIAKKLYKSSSDSDRMMAAMATVSISEPFEDFVAFLDEKFTYEALRVQLTSRIPSCCCEEFTTKSLNLYKLFEPQSEHSLSLVLAKHEAKFARISNP